MSATCWSCGSPTGAAAVCEVFGAVQQPDGGNPSGQVRPAGPTRTAVLRILPSEPPLVIPWFSRLRWRLVDALHFFTEARLRVVLATVFAANARKRLAHVRSCARGVSETRIQDRLHATSAATALDCIVTR